MLETLSRHSTHLHMPCFCNAVQTLTKLAVTNCSPLQKPKKHYEPKKHCMSPERRVEDIIPETPTQIPFHFRRSFPPAVDSDFPSALAGSGPQRIIQKKVSPSKRYDRKTAFLNKQGEHISN